MLNRYLFCGKIHDFIFLWVKGHLPVRLASFWVVEVFLEFGAI